MVLSISCRIYTTPVDSTRAVKNAVEEGSESFGYMLCLTASIGYYCYFRYLARTSATASA